jgi:predicted O-methyltransferase YrrM
MGISPLAAEYRRRSNEFSDIRVQMPILYAWAHLPEAHIVELGTRSGNSTSAFLAGIEHSGSGGELWSMDIASPQIPAEWLDIPFWHLLVADDLSDEALKFCPNQIDVLFSDTSHLYHQTVAELNAYVPRVKQGGIILIHDTSTPGTADAWPDVPIALNDFCEVSGLNWYNHPDWNGLGVIEVP